MHTRQANVHRLIPLLMPYLRQCHVIATEFRADDPGQLTSVDHARTDDWWHLLSVRHQRMVAKLMLKLNLGEIDPYRQLSPLLLVQSLSSELLGKDAPMPLDFALAADAREYGLVWEGIETLDEQWAVLQALPVKEQCRQLTQVVKHFSKFKKQLRKQVKWYLNQDIRQLYRDTRKSLKNLRKPLLLHRNKVMAIRMSAMSSAKPCFHAIGAAHLAGGKGVLRLLKKQGYSLKPIHLHLEADA
jgi:uncharacterized protein YbaP (TraB family)